MNLKYIPMVHTAGESVNINKIKQIIQNNHEAKSEYVNKTIPNKYTIKIN
jgi:hypothetical protein